MPKLMVQVLDERNKKPLPWVSVVVDGTKDTTDAQGRVTFEAAAGVHQIRIRTQAYRPFTGKITLPAAGGAFKISLEKLLM